MTTDHILADTTTMGLYIGFYLSSIFIGWCTINILVHKMTKRWVGEHAFTVWLTRFLGAVEQILFTTAYLLGHTDLIGLWLIMKTAGAWSAQDASASAHLRSNEYAIFLIGTGMSLSLSILTAWVIQTFLPPFPNFSAYRL